jgi:hypothetical protein
VLGSFVGMVSALDAKEISNDWQKILGSAKCSRFPQADPSARRASSFHISLLQRWEVLTEFALES